MDIYLLRHGLSLGNLKGFYESFADDALCDEGIEQAQKFSDSIKNASFDRICSSSMRRAMQSILPYLQANSLHAELWPEMEEACYQTEREAASSDWRKQPLPMDESLDQYFTLHGEAQHRVDEDESRSLGQRLDPDCMPPSRARLERTRGLRSGAVRHS